MLNFKESVAKVKSAPNFGKMATIGIQTSITKDLIFFFAFLESTLGGKSTLGVCGFAQTIEICCTSFTVNLRKGGVILYMILAVILF